MAYWAGKGWAPSNKGGEPRAKGLLGKTGKKSQMPSLEKTKRSPYKEGKSAFLNPNGSEPEIIVKTCIDKREKGGSFGGLYLLRMGQVGRTG